MNYKKLAAASRKVQKAMELDADHGWHEVYYAAIDMNYSEEHAAEIATDLRGTKPNSEY